MALAAVSLTGVHVVTQKQFFPGALHGAQGVDGAGVGGAERQVVGERDGEGEVPQGQGGGEGPAVGPGVVALDGRVEAGAAVGGQEGVQVPAPDGIEVVPDHGRAEVPSALREERAVSGPRAGAEAGREAGRDEGGRSSPGGGAWLKEKAGLPKAASAFPCSVHAQG